MGERVYASFEKGIAKFRSAETGPKSHLLADFSDYFHIHKHLMRPGRAIHMFTPHQTAK